MILSLSCPSCAGPLWFDGDQERFDNGRDRGGLGPAARLLRQPLACEKCGRRERLTVTLTTVRDYDVALEVVEDVA